MDAVVLLYRGIPFIGKKGTFISALILEAYSIRYPMNMDGLFMFL